MIAVCTAETLHSAFAGIAGLWTLGAAVVGTPPGQATRSFGEVVEQDLSNTGLTVSLSGAMYEWVPDPDGRVSESDRTLDGADFEAYERATDAELRLALDDAGVTDGRPPEPSAEPVARREPAVDQVRTRPSTESVERRVPGSHRFEPDEFVDHSGADTAAWRVVSARFDTRTRRGHS